VCSLLPYADLLVLIDSVEKERLASIYESLGYKVVGLPSIGDVGEVGGVLLIPRKVIEDIDSFRPSERYLAAYRPSKKEHARRAGKVRRASTILFDSSNIDLCDEEQIEVMKRGSAAVEITLSPLLEAETLVKYLPRVRRCVELASKEGVEVILSSGARRLEEIWPSGSIWALGHIIGVRSAIASWVEVLRRWRPGLRL